jgi:DNA-binding transcriptional MocR family regulator
MKYQSVSIHIDRHTGVPACRQIAAALEAEIRTGGLRPGNRLPPARTLAAKLQVNPVTVVTAFRRLAAAGWVESRVGSGTYVTRARVSPPPASGRRPRRGRNDAFSGKALKKVINRILDADGVAAFGSDEVAGYGPLRAQLRHYLTTLGIDPGEQEVLLFSGAQQALSVIVHTLLRRDDWVLIEKPTYPGIIHLLQRAGVQIATVELGPDGPDLLALERVVRARPIRLFYAMPTYQNPTGVSYTKEVARAVLRICAENGVTIVEDDALSDLDYGRGRTGTLRALAGAGQDLYYVKSFSRLLMPGFRMGFCLVPASTAEPLKRMKQEADLFSSGFLQRIVCGLLVDGHFAAHVRDLEQAERRRFSLALSAAHDMLDGAGFRILEPAGGSRLWVRLPAGIDPDVFFPICAREGMALRPGAEFAPDASTARAFSLTFAGVAFPDWRQLLERLRRLCQPAR